MIKQVFPRHVLLSKSAIQLLIFCVGALIVVGHRPSDLLHPQFFAEDGAVWYSEAYNGGWFGAFFFTWAGYFETLPRIAASIALLVPLYQAPLVMNCAGILFQVLPINVLMSSRCSRLGPWPFRSALALAYLFPPNNPAVHVTVTNAQWHLALLACLLISAVVAKTIWEKVFDVSVLILCGLTGPFCLMLLPVALLTAWKRPDNWRKIPVAIMVVTSAVQLGALLVAGRPPLPLGASAELLVEILAGHIYAAGLLGPNRLALIAPVASLLAIAVLGTSLIFYCFARAAFEFKMVIFFCALVLAASLRSPAGTALPAWPALRDSPVMRYWFLPTTAFAWTLLWCANYARSQVVVVLSGAAILIMCFSALVGYRLGALPDRHFRQYVAEFESSPSGTVSVIPVNPQRWSVRLVKK